MSTSGERRVGTGQSVLGWFVHYAGWLGGAAVAILMLHIIADVAGRYLFNSPIPGTIEVVSYWWMVLVAFPTLALTHRRREHIDVSIVTEIMPDSHRRLVAIFARLIMLAIVTMLGWYGWIAALDQMSKGEIAMGAATIWIWPMRFVVPFGMALLALQLVADLLGDIKTFRRGQADA